MVNNTQVIAFYLPQFYPTPENDKWWGDGFTEWTNVAKARPLFRGHYQPKLPGKLGFYDLRLPETREEQADLAREAGISGFCYWHYWFNGRRLLDRVFAEVVDSGKPDFPFCLCWANHSWFKKTWNSKTKNKLLIEQTYPGVDDYAAHFMAMLPAFKDNRYIRTAEGKLVFGIFDPKSFSDFDLFKETWNELALKNGLTGFDFFAYVSNEKMYNEVKLLNYDRIVYESINDNFKNVDIKRYTFEWLIRHIKHKLHRPLMMVNYSKYVETAIIRFQKTFDVIPCIDPMFDHSPRSNGAQQILHNNDPKLWGKLCREVSKCVESNPNNPDKFIFIKAWNEWGEGNYMEPDTRFGKAYIEEAAKAFK